MSEKETPNDAKTEKIGCEGYMMETCQDGNKSNDGSNGSGDTVQ